MDPPLIYRFAAFVSRPVLYGPFRLRAHGQENVPASGGCVLACNHLSNFDPWPLGMPLWPGHWLRFMAKAELYWCPATYVLNAACAFPVHRESADREALAHGACQRIRSAIRRREEQRWQESEHS